MKENNVVYLARLHWIIFLGPIVLFCLGIGMGFYIKPLRELAIFFALFSLAWGMVVWVTYQFSSLTLKKSQVILRTGFWVKKTIDIPLNKIESIDIRCSIVGSLFHYGSLVITGTGGTRQMVNCLNKPLTCRRYIEQLMMELNG